MPEGVINWEERGGLLSRQRSEPMPEAQSLQGCMEARERCRERIERLLESYRDEQRAVNSQVFAKLDSIRDRLPGTGETTATAPLRDRKFPWREVAAVIILAAGAIAAGITAVVQAMGARTP